jgi:hypothetical protein
MSARKSTRAASKQINAKDADGWHKLETVTITRKPAAEVA